MNQSGFEANIGVEAAERREQIRLPTLGLRRNVLGASLDPRLELLQRIAGADSAEENPLAPGGHPRIENTVFTDAGTRTYVDPATEFEQRLFDEMQLHRLKSKLACA